LHHQPADKIQGPAFSAAGQQIPIGNKVHYALPPTKISKDDKLLCSDYEGFAVGLDCARRATMEFRYKTYL